MVNGASSRLFQWQQAQVSQFFYNAGNKREGVFTWQRPISGWVTCNIDAAVFNNKLLSTFGCLIRDENGDFLAGTGGQFRGIVDPKVAEAMTFREALSWLKRMEILRVVIELDSLCVVQAFRQNPKDSSYFGAIILDCCSIVKVLFYIFC